MKKNNSVKLILCLFILIIIGQWIFSLGRILPYGQLYDFGFYLKAAQNITSGINPYFAENFNYPPPVLFLFYPFTLLPLFWSQILWTVVSVASLVFSIIFSFKSLSWQYKNNSSFLILLVPLVLLSFPVRWTFGLGQINFLLLFFIVLTYFFAVKKKDIWSGVCLGIAVILKMTPLFLVFYFLIKKRWKIAIVSLLTIVSLLGTSGIIFGFGLLRDYFTVVIPQLFEPTTKHLYYNQAFSSLSSGFIQNGIILNVTNLLFALAIIIFDLKVLLKTKTVNALDYGLAICSMLLINGFSWQHHFSLLIFPFLALMKIFPCLFSYHSRHFDKSFDSEGRALRSSTPRSLRLEELRLEELSVSSEVERLDLESIKIQKIRNYLYRFPIKSGMTWLLFLSCFLISFNFKHPELLGDTFLAKILLSHVFWGTLLLWFLLFRLSLTDKGASLT